jgi:hypothetical protein
MGLAARGFAESMLWEKHAATMWQIYQTATDASECTGTPGENENPNHP